MRNKSPKSLIREGMVRMQFKGGEVLFTWWETPKELRTLPGGEVPITKIHSSEGRNIPISFISVFHSNRKILRNHCFVYSWHSTVLWKLHGMISKDIVPLLPPVPLIHHDRELREIQSLKSGGKKYGSSVSLLICDWPRRPRKYQGAAALDLMRPPVTNGSIMTVG